MAFRIDLLIIYALSRLMLFFIHIIKQGSRFTKLAKPYFESCKNGCEQTFFQTENS